MGSSIEYTCKNCGYHFEEGTYIFFFNEDLTKLHIEMFGFLAVNELDESPLNGIIYQDFCLDCNEFQTTFIVEENLYNLQDKEIADLIFKLSKCSINNVVFASKFFLDDDFSKIVKVSKTKLNADFSDSNLFDNILEKLKGEYFETPELGSGNLYDDLENSKISGEIFRSYSDSKIYYIVNKNKSSLSNNEIKELMHNLVNVNIENIIFNLNDFGFVNDLSLFNKCFICGNKTIQLGDIEICPNCHKKVNFLISLINYD